MRLESVLDSSKRPLLALHGVQNRNMLFEGFHKSLNIACANNGAASWNNFSNALGQQSLQPVIAVAAAAVPPGSNYNMFALSHLAKHWLSPPVQHTAVGSTVVPGMTQGVLPALKSYFNAIKSYADVLVNLQDAASSSDYGGRGRPVGSRLVDDCQVEMLRN